MRLKIMAVKTANKAINKARVTGKLSLVAVAKMNMLRYYMEFALAEIGLGREIYKDKYQEVVQKFNSLVNTCPDIICNIREESCSSGEYEFPSTNVKNPYNPPTPVTPTEPEPEPTTHEVDMEDITIYPEYNVTTVLTVDLFDNKYIDEHGHTYDAIRIDDINSTNVGTFYVLGIPIVKGQTILKTSIADGEFTHVGSDGQDIISDSFAFSARDAVTGEWVQ